MANPYCSCRAHTPPLRDQAVYAALAFTAMGLLLARAWSWATVVVRAAAKIHVRLLGNVLRLPVRFFLDRPNQEQLSRGPTL